MTPWHLILYIAVGFTAYCLWELRKEEAAPTRPDFDPWVRYGQLPVRVIGMAVLLWSPEAFDMGLPWYLRAISGVVAAYGCLVMLTCIIELNFSASRGQWVVGPLVTTGPYQFQRHPFYAWIIVVALNASVFMANGVAYLFAVLLAILLIRRIPQEEADLLHHHGQRYIDYMCKTPRFCKGVW